MDGYVSKSAFATIYGCSKPYVSELVSKKRLVLSEDGKLVNVEASMRLLGVTSDPSKVGVRERWEAYRADGKIAAAAHGAPAATTPASTASLAGEQQDGRESRQADTSDYHKARTLREQTEAQLAQIELRKALGQLLEADPALRAISDIETAARVEIMALADRLTPLVAPESDSRKVYDLITAECERLCAARSRKLAALADAARASALQAA